VRGGAAVALALGPLVAACSPAGPSDGLPGGNVIRIEDPLGQLGDHRAAIRDLLTSTLRRTLQVLVLRDVTVTVIASEDPTLVIRGYGVGGRAPDGQTVLIGVDPGYPGLAQVLPERLPGILAHELNHCARWAGPGYGFTLLEALVSEGLADRFSIELLGVPVPPWCRAFPPDDTPRFLALAAPEFDSTTYQHGRWFFGGAGLPRWTGYTLGYRLVEAYLAGRPGVTAAQLVHTPAEAFRPR
jgi:hypothetical protein